MKRKIVSLALMATLVLAFAVTGWSAEYTLKFANPVSKDHAWGKAADKFADMVRDITEGRVEIQPHHSGALASIREALEMAKTGQIDFVLAGTGHVTGYVREIGITVLPYLWKDQETLFAALDGPFGVYMGSLMEAQGWKLAGWWDNGFRHVSNNRRPIMKPEDMRGLKIRCLPARVHVTFFRSLGAIPTPMGWTELYTGLQQGVVDSQENPPAMVYTGRLHEVQKFYSLTAHVNEPGVVLASKASLKKLPEELRLAVMVAMQKVNAWQREESNRDNEAVMEKLKDEGLKINEVPAETIAFFREKAQGVYPEAVKDFGPKGEDLVNLMVWFNK